MGERVDLKLDLLSTLGTLRQGLQLVSAGGPSFLAIGLGISSGVQAVYDVLAFGGNVQAIHGELRARGRHAHEPAGSTKSSNRAFWAWRRFSA